MTRLPFVHRSTARHRRRRARRGVAMVETALILFSFLILTLGMFDFGLAVYRNNLLSEAARQLARQAVVHGQLATVTGVWGPTTYNGFGNNNDTIAKAVKPYLVGVSPSAIAIKVEWPTSTKNAVGGTVRVTLSNSYRPITTFIFNASFTMQAVSEMQIAH